MYFFIAIALCCGPLLKNTSLKVQPVTNCMIQRVDSRKSVIALRSKMDHTYPPHNLQNNVDAKAAIYKFKNYMAKFFFSKKVLSLPHSKERKSPYFIGKLKKNSIVHSLLLRAFIQWKGTPYVYGGASSQGIDCSAFVQKLFRNFFHQHIPRTTSQQIKVGQKVAKSKLRTGDLVFFKMGSAKYHVGIFLEGDHFLDATKSRGVTESSLKNDYWAQRYLTARRVLLFPFDFMTIETE